MLKSEKMYKCFAQDLGANTGQCGPDKTPCLDSFYSESLYLKFYQPNSWKNFSDDVPLITRTANISLFAINFISFVLQL